MSQAHQRRQEAHCGPGIADEKIGLPEKGRLRPEKALRTHPDLRFRQAEFAARFGREVEALRRLDHPGIVRLLDAGEVDGVPYLVQDLVDGRNLAQRAGDRDWG